MQNNPTLIVMAAGMGSRYGGLKQLDQFGPSGETIMDYSIYDALRAGFDKVVFIIRESFAKDFEQRIVKKLQPHIRVELVYQEVDKLPEGFQCPEDRSKPWGTAHAVLMAKDVVNEPFAVINGDDFYDLPAFQAMGDFLKQTHNTIGSYALVGYPLGRTMSEHGSVARGICAHNEQYQLLKVTERTSIRYEQGQIVYTNENNDVMPLAENTPVSMNFWGFGPDWFNKAEQVFIDFLRNNINVSGSEFYIPFVVDQLLRKEAATVAVLQTNARWFGVTYKEDKPMVQQQIKQLIEAGQYPPKLWG